MSLANSLARRDAAVMLHPQTDWRAHETSGALVVARGEGVHVFDEDDKEYIEGMAGLWCTALGFSEPRLVEAARRQMSVLPYEHVYSHQTHGPAVELAERLLALAPPSMTKVFFACSGSEANDTIVRMIWYYNNALGRPTKKKIVSRRRGFHGSTCVSGSVTGLPNLQADFDLPLPGFVHTRAPHHYREGLRWSQKFGQLVKLIPTVLEDGVWARSAASGTAPSSRRAWLWKRSEASKRWPRSAPSMAFT